MSTISLKLRAEALGKSIENISDEIAAQLEATISVLAHSAYSEIKNLAQQRLHSTQQDYIDSLAMQKLDDNIYVITLYNKIPNDLESGYPGFSIKDNLLANAEKTSKAGYKYRDIPIQHNPYAKSAASPKITDLRSAALALIKQHGLDRTITDDEGLPVQGVAARIKFAGDTFPQSYLNGLTKIQNTRDGRTESSYFTFRRVSARPGTKQWQHPGFKGVHIFDDVERFLEEEMDRIIEAIL